MLFEYTGLSGCRIGASFIQLKQQRTTTAGRRIRSPGSTNWRSTMKTTKTFATALMFAGALGAAAASPNIEPNNVPFQGVYGTRMKARAPRCRPSWPGAPPRRPASGTSSPTTRPSPASTALRTTAPAAPRSKPIWPAPDRRPGVERRTQRHAVLRRLSRRMSTRRRRLAATNNPPLYFAARGSGGIFARRPAPRQRITGTWPRSRQV